MKTNTTQPVLALIQPRYLDVQAVAIYLSRTPRAVCELVAKRQVTSRRHGAKLVFDREELDACVHSKEGVDVREAVARTVNGGTVFEMEAGQP